MPTDPNDPNNPVPDPAQLNAAATAGEAAATALSNLDDVMIAAGTSSQNLNTQITISGIQLDSMQSSASKTGTAVEQMEDSIADLKTALTGANELTDKQTASLGLLLNKALGTRQAFDQLGAGIDPARLNTYSGQWESLSKTILDSGGSIASVAKKAEEVLGRTLPDAVKSGGILSINDFMKSMMRATDNTLRLQNALVQLSSSSGNLGEVFQAAGPHLEHVNELVNEQRRAMIDAAGATSMLPEQIEKYYAQLGSLPNALKATVGSSNDMINRSTGDTSGRISLLSASILTAVGSGREYSAVVTDMKEAFKDFNITGEDALKFSASISKISQDNKVDLDSVQTAVRGVANEFGRFADAGANAATIAQGLSESMDQYVSALQKSGMSGDHAISVFQGITSEVGKMTIAQKAFLSQQTGGPGGLQGAFQIEKMLKTGDIKGVLDKVRKQIEEQAGPAVSVEEAASSPAAAARLTRQVELLKQGPLGQFAKNDQDAYRMMDAFKTMGQGGAAPDFTDVLKGPMDKGLAIQDKSLTELQRIRIAQERAMASADMAATDKMQGMFSASPGFETGAVSDMQKRLQGSVGAAGAASGRHTGDFANFVDSGKTNIKTSNDMMKESVIGLGDLASFAMNASKNMIENAKNALTKSISEDQSRLVTASGDAATALEKDMAQKRAGLNQLSASQSAASATTAATGFNTSGFSSLDPANFGQPVTAGQRVGAAAGRTAGTLSTQQAINQATGAPHLPGQTGGAASQKIDVSVKGVCIQCGHAMDNSEHAVSVNPTYHSR